MYVLVKVTGCGWEDPAPQCQMGPGLFGEPGQGQWRSGEEEIPRGRAQLGGSEAVAGP